MCKSKSCFKKVGMTEINQLVMKMLNANDKQNNFTMSIISSYLTDYKIKAFKK